jgi:hypothetical protein
MLQWHFEEVTCSITEVLDIFLPPTDLLADFDYRMRLAREHYDAVREYRRRSRTSWPVPQQDPRPAVRLRQAPRRVHELRCMTRKNRISLLQMVRRYR